MTVLEPKFRKTEDEWLANRARETLANIKLGKEKTISWKAMKKRTL